MSGHLGHGLMDRCWLMVHLRKSPLCPHLPRPSHNKSPAYSSNTLVPVSLLPGMPWSFPPCLPKKLLLFLLSQAHRFSLSCDLLESPSRNNHFLLCDSMTFYPYFISLISLGSKTQFNCLYAAQEATARTEHGTTDWFQIGKGIPQGLYCHPAYAE